MNFNVWIINERIDEYTSNAKGTLELLSTFHGKVLGLTKFKLQILELRVKIGRNFTIIPLNDHETKVYLCTV